MNGRNIVRMILTAISIMVATSLCASDNNERFALHGRTAPENFAALQTGHDVVQVRSGGMKLLSSGSSSYPVSVGGSKQYEYISSVTITPKDGYYKITVKVICPKLYDAAGYPGYGSTLEYVNVWIDWNGDYSWSDSERVMAKSSANYKKILADNKILYFETTVKDASTAGGTFKARAMLGYGYNPTDPATYSWTWGDVMDVDVSFEDAEPEIYGVTIGAFASAGSISGGNANAAVSGVNPKVNANNAIIAGRDNYIYPEIKINRKYADSILANSNYKVIVSVDGEEIAKGTIGYGPYMGIQENGEWFDIYPVVDESGNTLKWNPPVVADKSKYGEKRLAVRLDCDHKLVCHLPLGEGYPCYVFYPADKPIEHEFKDFHPLKNDGEIKQNSRSMKVQVPMWYEMWSKFVDDLNKFEFDNGIGANTAGRTYSKGASTPPTHNYSQNPDGSRTITEILGPTGDITWKGFVYKISERSFQKYKGEPNTLIYAGESPKWPDGFKEPKFTYPIDGVVNTIKHELKHGELWAEHNHATLRSAILGGGTTYRPPFKPFYWEWDKDSDGEIVYTLNGQEWKIGDGLIDDREDDIGTQKGVRDTFDLEHRVDSEYKSYGDQELCCRIEASKVSAAKYHSQDWSYPGAQLTEKMIAKKAVSKTVQNSVRLKGAVPRGNYSSGWLSEDMAEVAMVDEGGFLFADTPNINFNTFADVTGDFASQGLILEAGLEHELEGDWKFSAYLFGTNGMALACACTIDELSAVNKTVRFVFSSDTIAKVREFYSGPYVLGRVICEVPHNAIANVYSAKNVLTTKDYSAYECKVSEPTVGSAMNDYADDTGLHVVMPVTVPSAGTYVISAHLATTNGMNLVNATTNCVCVEGKNSIDVCFPKDGVFNTKMSGRFLVRDVSVTPEGGESALFVCDYETNPYNYSDFDSGERTIVIQPDTIALSVSEDADDPYGLYKGIAVRFAVNNTKSSDYTLYRVSAILADTNGYNVAYAEEDLILNGYSTHTLFFSAQDIRGAGKDGPYTVKNIRITDRQTGDLIDACAVSSAKTVELSATDFKTKLTVEEDAICVTPVPVGSGVYSGVKLAVPVNSPSVGYVTLSVYVVAEGGHSVGRFEEEFEVQSGYNLIELVMDGAKFREARLNGPYTIKSIEVKHSASPDAPCMVERTLETGKYKYTQFVGQGEDLWQIGFDESQSVVDEGSHVIVRVVGGNEDGASSGKMYLSYQTATAADLDLAKGMVDGVTPKGGLKFPLTLEWEAGEIGEKVVTIPVKTDKTVEADEMFTLQLADAQGMELSEERVYTVTIKDAGYTALAAKIADGTATKAEQTQWSKLQRSGYYVRALADAADGGKVTGSGLCAEGKKVTVKATANKNFTFIGWCDGAGNVVAMTATLVIDRSAKPAANTKTSTTLTDISGDATFYAMFKSDPSVNVTIESSDGYGALVGKVSGAGKYAPGKKVTLKATANPGYVFSYWFWTNEEGDQCFSREANISFVMGTVDVEMEAMFVLNWEDAENIYMSVCDDEWLSSGSFADATVRCGIAINWPIWMDTLSVATVKATGLPAGLKLVQDKDTKEFFVSGVPTAVSKTNAQTGEMVPSVVKFTVTTAGKNTRTFEKRIFVKPLPQWAYGTFNGSIGHRLDAEDDYRFDGRGTITMTVSAAGKISGKVALDGTNYTFSASGYSDWSYVEDDDSDAYLLLDVEAKSVKATIPVVLYGYRENQWLSGENENAANCVFWGDGEECGGYDIELRRDLWKDIGNAVALSEWAGAYTYVTANGDVLSLAVDEKGGVKAVGTLGTKRKVSFSTALHPYFVDIYVTPTKTDIMFFERIWLANWHEEAVPGGGIAYRDAGVVMAVESLDGTGAGTVTANPKYGQAAVGKSVTLTAKTAKDSVFVKWVYEDEEGEEQYGYSSTLKLVSTGDDIPVRALFMAKANVLPPEPYVADWESWNRAVVGRDFTGAVFVDDMARPVSFSAKNLPAGLKIDKTTGVISGTPTKVFDGVVTVTATSTLNSKMKGSVEIPMKVRDANAIPNWARGVFYGHIVDYSETTGNPVWGLARGVFTAAIVEDGSIAVEMKTGYGLASFTSTTLDYSSWDDDFAEFVMTGTNGEQLSLHAWVSQEGNVDMGGTVTGGIFGQSELKITGDHYDYAFEKVNGKYVHKNMSWYANQLVRTWHLYVKEYPNAGVPVSSGDISPYSHYLETWALGDELPSVNLVINEDGTAILSGEFLGEKISATVPVLVAWCDDESDSYRVTFWQKLKNGKECYIDFDLRTDRKTGEPDVFGWAWLREYNESTISDAELLKLQFKAELAGIAVVDDCEVFYDNDALSKVVFLPPQTPVSVSKGKWVLFKLSYDFPVGYGASLATQGNWPVGDNGTLYINPSPIYYDSGVAYGFIGLENYRKTCTIESVSITTGARLMDDDKMTYWRIGITPVKITFKK